MKELPTPEQLRTRYNAYRTDLKACREELNQIKLAIYRLRNHGVTGATLSRALGLNRSTIYTFTREGAELAKGTRVSRRSALD